MIYGLISLAVLLIIAIYGLMRLLVKVEYYEDFTKNAMNSLTQISKILKESGEYINTLDEKGILRSDDEIGHFFDSMKHIQEELNKYALTLENEEEKENK